LGKVDFSLFLTGKTGVFKTAVAARCQQHFGAALDASGLPANFGMSIPGVRLKAQPATAASGQGNGKRRSNFIDCRIRRCRRMTALTYVPIAGERSPI